MEICNQKSSCFTGKERGTESRLDYFGNRSIFFPKPRFFRFGSLAGVVLLFRS